MGARALVLEAHHTTHIEGTRLTLEQSERLLAGEMVPGTDPDDVRELLNYGGAFEFVSTYLGHGGVAQFQLVHIHPFIDGNGRTSRLLSTLCLYRSGYDFERLCPDTHRRTLQRDLKELAAKKLLRQTGATNRLQYLAGKELA